MIWMALGVIAMAWIGLHALSLLTPNEKAEADKLLANVIKDHVTRAENGPTSKRR